MTSPVSQAMKVNPEAFSSHEVPDDVRTLLVLTAQNWDNPVAAEQYINQALARAEEYPDIWVAAYRYFYYKNNLAIALEMAENVLGKVKQLEHLPDTWEQLRPILIQRRQDPNIRLYLNTYAATGFILAKMGNLTGATEVTERMQQVDPADEFGGSIVLDFVPSSETN